MTSQSKLGRRELLRRMTIIATGTVVPSFTSYGRHSDTTDRTIYLAPGDGKKGRVGDMEITFKLNSGQTDSHLGIWESVVQSGELGAPPHFHKTLDEICYVKEGSIFILTGELVTEVQAGGWHLRPKGIVHTFWNSGSVPATTIDMSVPGGHEAYMEDLAALFENGNRPTRENMKLLSERHDVYYRYDLLDAIVKKYRVRL